MRSELTFWKKSGSELSSNSTIMIVYVEGIYLEWDETSVANISARLNNDYTYYEDRLGKKLENKKDNKKFKYLP